MSLSNLAFRLILGDFNCRSNSWWKGDISTKEGIDLESVSSSHGLHQLITDPTHILPQSSSCIDLIFIDQPNLVIDSGVHSSLHANCHHQITHCKLNLKIVFPLPYECLVWNYRKADVTAIRKALDLVNWEFIFLNKTIHDQVLALDQVLMNIFTNYIPNKYKFFDDQNPPQMNDCIKSKIQQKNSLFKQYVKNRCTAHDYQSLQFATKKLSDYIMERKNEQNFPLSQSLNNPATSSKTYWTILQTFYSGKKIPLIPPLVIKNQLITDFWEKATYFSLHFARQCTPIENDSSILAETNCLCDATILAVDFENQDILKIIRALDINKAHSHENISTRMIKICDSSIVKPLSIIFYNSLNSGLFLDNWKRSNFVPVHKKGNKQLIQNYRRHYCQLVARFLKA